MTLHKTAAAFAVALSLAVAGLPYGCSSDKSNNDVDKTEAEKLVVVANDSLGRQMNHFVNITMDDPDTSLRPDDIDLSGVNAVYEKALELDPENANAKFGTAFTGLIMFLANEDLNDLIDDFKHTYDTMTFNPFRPAKLMPSFEVGLPPIPDRLPLRVGGLHGILPALMMLDQAAYVTAAGDPQVSDIQILLEEQLLPKVVRSRELMIEVCDEPSYTFAITPMMQGNSGSDPIVLDRSDFQVMLATLYAAEAGLHVFFARNLNLSAYTAEAAQDALSQDSDFLSLKTGGVGVGHMQSAKHAVLAAEEELESAIDNLLAEIGTDQTDDLIRVYSRDTDDLIELRDSLSHYRTYFDGPKLLNVRWWEEEFEVTVDINEFFDAPMDNPKSFLPAYSVTIEELHLAYRQFASAHFSRSRYWDALETIFGITYPNDGEYFGLHLPDADNDQFYQMLGDRYNNQQFVFGWDNVVNYCEENSTDLYCYESSNQREFANRYRAFPDQIRICYTWEANSLNTWTWPDATFKGLFPGLTSSQLKEILIDNDFDWQKSQCYESAFDF